MMSVGIGTTPRFRFCFYVYKLRPPARAGDALLKQLANFHIAQINDLVRSSSSHGLIANHGDRIIKTATAAPIACDGTIQKEKHNANL